ncbi:MAG: hypothetical protein U0232_32760 [Thermomicrobiales bacterium]
MATSITCGRSTRSWGAGGIKGAVERGLLKRGIMYECVRNNVP